MKTEAKEKEVKTIAIIAIVVAVVGISIAYAAMTTTLKITGRANMNSANWNIEFQSLTAEKTGDAVYTAPTLAATSLSNYSVTLTKPGDSVTFKFKLANTGNIDAKLKTITKGKPVCIGTGESADDDENLVCQNIIFDFKYQDGKPIVENDSLNQQTTKDVILTIEYNNNTNNLPKGHVTVNGLDVVMLYEQA